MELDTDCQSYETQEGNSKVEAENSEGIMTHIYSEESVHRVSELLRP